tara:strand:- start:2154 stop:2426 length:273 start_codon:yes stop_codon:yes gene_type:complete
MSSFENIYNYTETEINNLTAQFRVNRNLMLKKTDAIIMPDRNPDARYTQFRQKLRDIPQNQPNFINGLDDDYFTEWEWEKWMLLGAGMMD